MFKILFILISIFLSINSYASEIKKDLDDVLNLSIEPYCNEHNGNLEGFELKNLKSLKIKFNNSRKFLKQNLQILSLNKANNDFFKKKKSKKHSAKITVYYKNNNICEFKSKVRIHGDGMDHFELYNGVPVSSMHVELSSGNIGGITKFKLLLPQAEGGDSEVFNSNLFRHLGFLAPRTVKVELNYLSKNIPYLFQEIISKEFIEFNKLKEGIVLEPSEDGDFSIFRVENKNWLKNFNNILIGGEVLHDINTALYKSKAYYLKNNDLKKGKNFQGISTYDYNWLSNEQTNYLKYLSEFEALIYGTNSNHALGFTDRRFFYDEVFGQYHPIYYDAESYLISGKNKNGDNNKFEKAIHYAVNNANSVHNKINNLNLYSFQKDLSEANLHIKKKEIDRILNKVKNNLILLSKSEKLSYNNIKYKFNDLNYIIPNSVKFVYGGGKKNFNICDKEFSNCIEQPANKKLLNGFLRQRTKQQELLYVGTKKISKSFDQSIRLNRGVYLWQSKKIVDDIYLKYNGSTEVSLDKFKKKITININNYNDRAIIFSNNDDNEINGWEIFVNIAGYLKKNDKLYILREKDTNLTGCLTISNLKLKKLNIFVNGSVCEDGLNIVNSSGNINKIEINNSYSDAVDFDYSNVSIEEIIIKNSGNDCVDFSAGIYFIKKILASGCTDKAISIGEKSKVIIGNSILENSFAGIVVKDSSILELGKNKINTDYCILGYRKKQEFYGVVLNIKEKLNCKNDTLIQKGSVINYVF